MKLLSRAPVWCYQCLLSKQASAVRRRIVPIEGFQKALPSAKTYLYDNNSTAGTIQKARAAGAIVATERMYRKGNLVRRIFSEMEAPFESFRI